MSHLRRVAMAWALLVLLSGCLHPVVTPHSHAEAQPSTVTPGYRVPDRILREGKLVNVTTDPQADPMDRIEAAVLLKLTQAS